MITNKVTPTAMATDDEKGLTLNPDEASDNPAIAFKVHNPSDEGGLQHNSKSHGVRFADDSLSKDSLFKGDAASKDQNLTGKMYVQQSLSLLGVPRQGSELEDEPNDNKVKLNFLQKSIWTMLQPTDNRLSMKLFGSKKGIILEKKRLQAVGSLIIHPCSTLRVNWDFLMIITLVINLITIPVSITFFKQEEIGLQWIIINCVSDTLFITDIFFNFRTGILNHDSNELVILQPKLIAKHYFRTWFFLDLISSMPMDYIILLMGGGNESIYKASRALRFLRMAKLLSLLRLLRLSRLVRFIRHWEQVKTLRMLLEFFF
ncbi:potassium/sodium hyperpolarization-activated cyclic nucleotide-gated channel 1-like [Anneissia japonica]|uniref:potassium/sodium hyperpolarization-activated cyclic nucleotide-gated channel 1-like n=1 Tax=Anneissia japonica TaxID=1529436 RepID=UPI00142592D6|nr:potassium/sodium hyperpolarization-activated cyclic nucleotide-gated channel 1-like [Anneissia japonica]